MKDEPMHSQQLELPFIFEGHIIMSGILNGSHKCDHIILDTGAPSVVVWVPEGKDARELGIGSSGEITSLVINSVEFGPVCARLKRVSHTKDFHVFLGTEQLKRYCLILDYERQKVLLQLTPFNTDRQCSAISFSRGRPVIDVDIAGRNHSFVLDTGSNVNWVFWKSQTNDLFEFGQVKDDSCEVKSGLGDINATRSVLFPVLNFGGKLNSNIKMRLGNEKDFGGVDKTWEDGILGTGEFASWHHGLQIIDFLSGRFLLSN